MPFVNESGRWFPDEPPRPKFKEIRNVVSYVRKDGTKVTYRVCMKCHHGLIEIDPEQQIEAGKIVDELGLVNGYDFVRWIVWYCLNCKSTTISKRPKKRIYKKSFGKPGPKKVYESNAQKQAAYRQRKLHGNQQQS